MTTITEELRSEQVQIAEKIVEKSTSILFTQMILLNR